MLFCRSRLWNKQSTLPSCLHSVWLTTGVTHDQFARKPDFTRASRVIRRRPGYASLVHSFTMLFNAASSWRHRAGRSYTAFHQMLQPASAVTGRNIGRVQRSSSHRRLHCPTPLVPRDPADKFAADQLRRLPVQRPAALQRPCRLVRAGRVSRDASASAIGRYPSIGRLPSLAASTIMTIYFQSLHGVQVASRPTNMQFSNNEIISNKPTAECPLQCPLRHNYRHGTFVV
jgi:hypothetical protein